MSIISQPATPPEPVLANAVTQIKNANTQLFRSITQQHTMVFNMIWNNKSFTPAQILTAFGTDAAMLFAVSQDLQNLAKSVDSTYTILVPPSKYTVTINADGTVTITG